MAATGPLADARAAIVSQITTSGYAAVTDPRNARPLTVFVELPSITAVTHKVLGPDVHTPSAWCTAR